MGIFKTEEVEVATVDLTFEGKGRLIESGNIILEHSVAPETHRE